ncbi:MAG: rRNA maturation RNase YbeY [Acidimicrobiia bacterium]
MTATVKGPNDEIDLDALTRFAQAILDGEGLDDSAAVTIRLVSNDEIAELNETHLGRSGPTDVLAFPIEDAEPGNPPKRLPGAPPLDLGDIFIATHVVHQHADEYGVDFSTELHLMVCHGLLHLLGWDHETTEDAERMEQREADHLGRVGMVRRP